jgi:hypothetical protein
MTISIKTHHSSRRMGTRRFASAGENAKQQHRGMSGTPGLTTVLLSALAAAVMVVADQLMDSLAEAHLLVLWLVLWATAFAALVLFSGAARMAATRTKAGMDEGSRSSGKASADSRVRNDRQAAAESASSDAEAYRDLVKPQLRTMSARAKRLARFS